MEDFKSTRADEPAQISGLQAEWFEAQKTNITSKSESCLSLAFNATDKQEPASDKTAAAGKDTAESLDKDLKDFANSKLVDPSRDMQNFQKAVGKFSDATDKEAAMDELGDTWSRINAQVEMKAEALYRSTKAEANNTPGRKELVAAHKAKQDLFWDKAFKQPLQESFRIQDLMMRQPGETKPQQEERIRKGLESNKPMLAAYNEITNAEANIEANKGPREKQLERLSSQLDSETEVMRQQVEKAYIRSTMKN